MKKKWKWMSWNYNKHEYTMTFSWRITKMKLHVLLTLLVASMKIYLLMLISNWLAQNSFHNSFSLAVVLTSSKFLRSLWVVLKASMHQHWKLWNSTRNYRTLKNIRFCSLRFLVHFSFEFPEALNISHSRNWDFCIFVLCLVSTRILKCFMESNRVSETELRIEKQQLFMLMYGVSTNLCMWRKSERIWDSIRL